MGVATLKNVREMHRWATHATSCRSTTNISTANTGALAVTATGLRPVSQRGHSGVQWQGETVLGEVTGVDTKPGTQAGSPTPLYDAQQQPTLHSVPPLYTQHTRPSCSCTSSCSLRQQGHALHPDSDNDNPKPGALSSAKTYSTHAVQRHAGSVLHPFHFLRCSTGYTTGCEHAAAPSDGKHQCRKDV
jgi:hypothetical protein